MRRLLQRVMMRLHFAWFTTLTLRAGCCGRSTLQLQAADFTWSYRTCQAATEIVPSVDDQRLTSASPQFPYSHFVSPVIVLST